jgi:antitoxin ParD1/3/4
MHIRFAEADQQFINAQAQQGFYTNETEVVRDAVRRLREQREAQQSPFYKAVMRGHEQIERGQTVPFSASLMNEIQGEVVKKAKGGKKRMYDPATIPPENDD